MSIAATVPCGAMSIFEHPVNTLAGEPSSLARFEGSPTLIVNVASRCGLTPQYTGLEALQERYGDQGFNVVGFPCNQFGEQEPGTAEEIETFCSTTYGVTFPMMEKIEVNGAGPAPDLRRAHRRSPTPRATPATSAGTSRSSSSARTARSPASRRMVEPAGPRPRRRHRGRTRLTARRL